MNNLDYSKIEIYTPKINAYFLMSIYFCIINMYAVFHEYPLVVSSLSSIISMFYAFKLLMEYKTKEKDFLNKYKDIINFNT